MTSSEITYDTITQLFFSLDKDYRKNAKWLMNDETAMQLRQLKSDSGMPLWNHNTDTIFSHEVVIMNEIPSTGTPIAFGDFRHYAIVMRIPLTMNVLREKFILNGHIGYAGYEFLDAKLLRQDAVKLLKLETV
ncbi:phage major capsid protein [Enterococcus faecalis]|uniref:phage major capsid protein n=1 Tax=Enterococcus TaxID=1350 RepID=UPI0006ACEC41|nr:phage major capsid protein [Enterococcus faecalis]EGO2587019.1 phage major capsid protein [Enterococcus faecalis]EGO2833739.1 phage major capsid protein [Enterococcus faecalis]EGO5850095.1 phage major capsid protein [Enterococcus faecalis]EHS2034598.1 phage major capsid protein [Enterococcus faecalis]EIA1377390.1 phage major capsid protein [Enterococcus faecalis]